METYTLIIGISLVIIISFFFNIFAKKTNIPSVLMLITLGVLIKEFLPAQYNLEVVANLSTLEIVGNIGLVMIVLEAALDLKLSRDKRGLIINSFLVGLISLVISSFAMAALIFYIIPGASQSFYNCFVYAVPLSIMSSAIIIPSVGGLTGVKKEFMVYESTFSDILGIMLFYFLVEIDPNATLQGVIVSIGINIIVTIILSIILAYGMVFVFQRLTSQVKLFLVISVLMLLFALGKKYHLSSLLVILAFGLVLNNTSLFFRGERIGKLINEEKVKPIMHDFHILTLESAFVIRTFFFVIFGMFITLGTIFDPMVALISLGIVAVLYSVRFLVLILIVRRNITPQFFIAPRGLITILLFFVIGGHEQFVLGNFDPGILLLVILVTSSIMTVALIVYRKENVREVLFSQLPRIKADKVLKTEKEKTIEKNVEEQDFNEF